MVCTIKSLISEKISIYTDLGLPGFRNHLSMLKSILLLIVPYGLRHTSSLRSIAAQRGSKYFLL